MRCEIPAKMQLNLVACHFFLFLAQTHKDEKMQKVKAFLTRTVWKKVKVWHLLLVLFIIAGANDESSSNSTEYHNLGGGYGDEYSWLQINPDGTAAIFNSKKKNGKPDGLKSCLANGTWTKVNGKKKVRGFSNANCPWVSRHNNTEW